MRSRNRRSLVGLLSVALLASPLAPIFQSTAVADVISTEQYLDALDRDAKIARIDAALAREEVRDELQRLGVDPNDATARVAALTDDELSVLATRLDEMPAGGDALAVVGVVFIVLLILELVGVIDIFKKI